MCECIKKVNALLSDKGFKLDTWERFSRDDHSFISELNVPMLRLDGKRISRKDIYPLIGNYCIFCGEKMRSAAEDPTSEPL